MVSQSRFGGNHTEKKLQAVEQYLKAFLQVLSRQNFETIYIDAFAGSGARPLDLGGELLKEIDDARDFLEGSAIRALRLERQFDRYIFIEKDEAKLSELRTRVGNVATADANIDFICGDAAEKLIELCNVLKRKNVRSVVFLDPFGSQVGWKTLKALADTGHVDLWYLFPSGLSVNRQISSKGQFTPEQEKSLNRLFGPHDWKERLLRTEVTYDLFGPIETTEKAATISDITRFMIECLDEIFAGKALKTWLPLGRDGAHWYSLLFAMANSSESARKIGHEVAKHIMTTK